jgi:hypothetical protein
LGGYSIFHLGSCRVKNRNNLGLHSGFVGKNIDFAVFWPPNHLGEALDDEADGQRHKDGRQNWLAEQRAD